MKNLIYKELKLAVHPICYLLIMCFPLMVLIPSYPLVASFIYCASCYPILFLGANKGQQSNDLLYTALLPVRKKDIVKARIYTCAILLAIATLITIILLPFCSMTHEALKATVEEQGSSADVGLEAGEFGSIMGFVLFSFVVYDAIFFLCYYKNGKRIALPTFVGILAFTILSITPTTVLPSSIPGYEELFHNPLVQVCMVIGGLMIYVFGHYLIYKKASDFLEKVDLN